MYREHGFNMFMFILVHDIIYLISTTAIQIRIVTKVYKYTHHFKCACMYTHNEIYIMKTIILILFYMYVCVRIYLYTSYTHSKIIYMHPDSPHLIRT